MPTNLELKIKVTDHRKFERKLNSINAEFKRKLTQRDVYFKIKNGMLKLRTQDDRIELIKYNRDEKNTRWSDYEILLISGADPEKYLTSLFEVEAVVEKKRKLYLFNNTRIHLDKVEKLGCFLELETLVIRGVKDAEKRFDEISRLLEIDSSRQIRKSYRDLILKK